jgi:hypothetical protein
VPDLAPFHPWIVFVHVLGVLGFLVAHGVSAAAVLRLRTERDPVAVRTLLDLSRRSMTLMSISALVWLAAGVLAGFSGNYWTGGRYWIWVSLLLVLAILIVMTPMGRIYLNRVRAAVGIDSKTGAIDSSAPVDPATLEAAIASGRPTLLAVIGLGGVAILTGLMYFKPF